MLHRFAIGFNRSVFQTQLVASSLTPRISCLRIQSWSGFNSYSAAASDGGSSSSDKRNAYLEKYKDKILLQIKAKTAAAAASNTPLDPNVQKQLKELEKSITTNEIVYE